MQEKPTPKAKKRMPSLGNITLLLIGTTFMGQLLGFIRTRLVNGNFEPTGPQSTDAYFAAFIIPDLFFYTLAAGALGVAFMPFLSDRLLKADKRSMWELVSSLLNLLSIVMLAVGIVIFIFARQFLQLMVPDMTPEQLDNATMIMRLISLNPLFFTIAGVLTSAQQVLGRFFFYAIAPLFYNLSIIASIYIFRDTSLGLVGLGVGALIGGALQLLVICLGLVGTRFQWSPKIMWRAADFKSTLRQLPSRSLDQGIDQVQSMVETRYARGLGEGNISYWNNAFTLHMAPILLLGSAISTAVFPRLNKRLSQGRPDLFRKDFLRTLRIMIWTTVPVVIACYFARGYIARLIFAKNAPEIALIFGFLTVAIFFRILYAIVSRWFYAQKDTKTPLFISIVAIGLNIILVAALTKSYDIAGLAIAQSIAAMVEVLILGSIMLYRDSKLFDKVFLGALVRILSVAGFSLVAGYIMVHLLPLGANETGFLTLGGKFAAIVGAIFTVYLSISAIFGLEEASAVLNRVKRLIFRSVKVQY